MKTLSNILLLIMALTIVSCSKGQSRDTDFIERATPNEVGVDTKIIDQLITDIDNTKLKNIHALLIIKDNKLITEKYFNSFDKDRLQYSASVSKSFGSTLLGIAIDKGFFGDDIQTVLNKKVSELFPKYAEIIKKDPLKEDLKLNHILSMTAGFEWDEHTYLYSDNRNDCHKINNHEDPMHFLFERKLINKPGKEFYYNGGLSLSVSYLIKKYTHMSVDKFTEKYLFKPLGIKNYRWDTVANGLIDTDGGLHLKPIDQAKLGYLFLNQGVWKGKQIVSKDWVKISTTMHIKNTGMPDYAYQWWGGDFKNLNRSYYMYMASGHGGQKIVVIPQFDLVLVLTQQVFNNPYSSLNFLAIMSDYVLPAITKMPHLSIKRDASLLSLKVFEGHFVNPKDKEYIDIKSEEGKLIFTSNNGKINDFYPLSEYVFRTRIRDLFNIDIRFVKNSSNVITGLETKLGFKSKEYKKTK